MRKDIVAGETYLEVQHHSKAPFRCAPLKIAVNEAYRVDDGEYPMGCLLRCMPSRRGLRIQSSCSEAPNWLATKPIADNCFWPVVG